MRIGSVEIGGTNPCRFVAEISNNHNGDLARALRLIEAAVDAGADVIKLQAFTSDELVSLRGDGPAPAQWGEQGYTMRSLYEKARTPLVWFPRIIAECEMLKVPWFSSVFGLESLALLESMGCPAYKIARLDNTQTELINRVLDIGKPLIVSRNPDYRGSPAPNVAFLYCPPGYPAVVDRLPSRFSADRFLGLSSHCLAPELPVAAIARGCKLIEMHFQLAEEPSELEANISLDEHQFKAMVESVRTTEALCG